MRAVDSPNLWSTDPRWAFTVNCHFYSSVVYYNVGKSCCKINYFSFQCIKAYCYMYLYIQTLLNNNIWEHHLVNNICIILLQVHVLQGTASQKFEYASIVVSRFCRLILLLSFQNSSSQ